MPRSARICKVDAGAAKIELAVQLFRALFKGECPRDNGQILIVAPEIAFGVLNNLLFKSKKSVEQLLGISAKLINVHMGCALVGRRQNVGFADQRVD